MADYPIDMQNDKSNNETKNFVYHKRNGASVAFVCANSIWISSEQQSWAPVEVWGMYKSRRRVHETNVESMNTVVAHSLRRNCCFTVNQLRTAIVHTPTIAMHTWTSVAPLICHGNEMYALTADVINDAMLMKLFKQMNIISLSTRKTRKQKRAHNNCVSDSTKTIPSYKTKMEMEKKNGA